MSSRDRQRRCRARQNTGIASYRVWANARELIELLKTAEMLHPEDVEDKKAVEHALSLYLLQQYRCDA